MFASLDDEARSVSFQTEDAGLGGKVFAVFIRANVDVTLEVQEPLSVTMEPFYVTVLRDDSFFKVPNQAPQIVELKESIEVEAGLHSSMLLGYPVDLELDDF